MKRLRALTALTAVLLLWLTGCSAPAASPTATAVSMAEGGNTAPEITVDGAIAGLQQFENLSQTHNDDVVYPDTGLPLPGGMHAAQWLNCGIYITPVEMKNAVHSMEHGAVWITYDNLSDADITTLQGLVKGHDFVILSPFPNQKSPIVLSAWGLQLELEATNDARIPLFIDTYEQGPQNPEPGAPCSGGVGEPVKSQ